MNIAVTGLIPVIVLATMVQGTEVFFAGLTGEGAPSFEREFDRQLREDLAGTQGITVTDESQAHALQRAIDIHASPSISAETIKRIRGYVPDTAILAWGRISRYDIGAQRHDVLAAAAAGNLTITLSLYSLRLGTTVFTGDVTAHAEIHKGFIWFYPVDKVVHVTAADKQALITQLIAETARKTSSLIATVAASEAGKARRTADARPDTLAGETARPAPDGRTLDAVPVPADTNQQKTGR